MSVNVDALLAELVHLRQYRGARGRRLLDSSPELDAVSRVVETDGPAQKQQKLTSVVVRLLSDRSDQELLLVALGLHPDADQNSLGDRLAWLAHTKERWSVRTLERRLDETCERFAHAARASPRAGSAPGDVGYTTLCFDGSQKITGDHARFRERRTISVVQDRLVKIGCCLGAGMASVKWDEAGITFWAAGVRLPHELRGTGQIVECHVRLPSPLRAGDRYEFEVTYSLPTSHLRPHYVVQPVTPFERIALAVQFDPFRLPAQLWQVNEAKPWKVDTPPSDAQLLRLDLSGLANATFDDAREGRAYGLVWSVV